jgi:hypothetical protein
VAINKYPPGSSSALIIISIALLLPGCTGSFGQFAVVHSQLISTPDITRSPLPLFVKTNLCVSF